MNTKTSHNVLTSKLLKITDNCQTAEIGHMIGTYQEVYPSSGQHTNTVSETVLNLYI